MSVTMAPMQEILRTFIASLDLPSVAMDQSNEPQLLTSLYAGQWTTVCCFAAYVKRKADFLTEGHMVISLKFYMFSSNAALTLKCAFSFSLAHAHYYNLSDKATGGNQSG